MDEMFRKMVESAPPEIKPRVIKKFVDDSLSAVKESAVKQLTDHMNSLDPTGNLKYTCEMPENDQIPCLDVLFHRQQDGALKTTVYRKATHTDQYLNFASHHPLHHKQGVVRTLIDRADAIISDPDDRKEEYKHVCKALQVCGYPKRVIEGVIRRRNIRQSRPTKPKKNATSPQAQYRKHMVVIPYVKGLSEKVQRIFKKHDIHCAFKPHNTLRSMLVRPKDPRPALETSDCVYKIPCANCEVPYIGETSRHLKHRLKEHQDSVKAVAARKFTRSRVPQAKEEEHKSALADHAAQCNHVIDWKNTSVLASHCSNKKGRWIQEAIHVRAEKKGTLNRNEGGYELSRCWDSLLRSCDRAPRMRSNLRANMTQS